MIGACSNDTPAIAEVVTATNTSLPTPTSTRDIFSVTPATRDPLIGPPTLPPTFTATPTLTPTSTLTPTPTPTITTTPTIEELCEAIEFPLDNLDGMSFPDDGGTPFYVSIDIPLAQLNWTIRNIETDEERILTIPGGYKTLVVPGNVSDPGTYEWHVTVTTESVMDVCERTVIVTIEEPEPEPIDLSVIGDLLRGLFGLGGE